MKYAHIINKDNKITMEIEYQKMMDLKFDIAHSGRHYFCLIVLMNKKNTNKARIKIFDLL